MLKDFYHSLSKELTKREEKSLLRSLKLTEGIDFSSNDYLGLSGDPRILDALREGIQIYGAGSTASRLIRGHRNSFEELEFSFSGLVKGTDSLLVANGFTANLGLIDSIADLKTVVFTDRLNHASILDGIRLSGAKRVYYNHLDMDDLRSKLDKHNDAKRKIIISETIFSMDGDALPLDEFVELGDQYGAVIVLDETHALGVFGEFGGGLSCDGNYLREEYRSRIDYRIYTLGKAMGLEGGIIVFGDELSKSYLVNVMRNFIFSTAPMPAIAHAGVRACELLQNEKDLVESVLRNANLFRIWLHNLPFPATGSVSQIIPLILNSEKDSLNISEYLYSKGLDVRAIRPPTVPSPRLRISIHANHNEDELKLLYLALKNYSFEQG